jgi:4-diphosphocytidyl-2-C-methyl-D-erythritol kinase
VNKHIPVAAGLGGGSSDAAATLRALDALFDTGLPASRLRELAAALGSDVPFFLAGPAALVEGRGERVVTLVPRADYAIIAVFCQAAMGTAEAYALLDKGRIGEQRLGPEPKEIARMYQESPVSAWRFANDFDEPVLAHLPILAKARAGLLDAGALAARLTGSGATMIGIFGGAEAAWRGAASLAAAGMAVVVLLPLATIPDVCYNEEMRIRQGEATHGNYGHSHQEGRI